MAKTKLFAAITAAATIVGASAHANTVTLTEQTPGDLFGNLGWSETVEVSTDGGSSSQNFVAGAFELNDGIRDLLAFCLDPINLIDLNQDFDTHIVAPEWAAALTDIDKLFTTSYGMVEDAASAAGFQIALWEVIIDQGGPFDIKAGDLIVNASAEAEAFATTALMALAGAGTGGYKLITYVNDGQDLISAVPVPGAALLMAPGLAALAMRKRRKA